MSLQIQWEGPIFYNVSSCVLWKKWIRLIEKSDDLYSQKNQTEDY